MDENAKSIKKLIVVSTEDASKISAWSNVPYLFCETLKTQGVELVPVTLHENPVLRRLIFGIRKCVRFLTGWSSSWDYSRSRLHAWHARKQIDLACRMNSHDAVLVLSFSYSPSLPGGKPLFLFGDWSYAYAIEVQRGRSADYLEKDAIRREQHIVEMADAVFVLFPVAQEHLERTCPRANSYYLGNVINAVEQPDPSDVDVKCKSMALIFIGKAHYIEGAAQLLRAYENLKPRYPLLSLDIIGIDRSFFRSLPDGVTCHGYLDKGVEKSRKLYYRILRRARLFINTNPNWASFSALLEALYFYTPVISSRYPELVETFGEPLPFGHYFVEGGGVSLERLITELLEDSNYREKAVRAHEATRSFSWDNYVKEILTAVERRAEFSRRNQGVTNCLL